MLRVASVLALALLALMTQMDTTYAHEGWFVDKGLHSGEHFALDAIMLVVIVGTLLFIASAIMIDRSIWSRKLDNLVARAFHWLPRETEWRLVAILFSAMFIANAVLGVFLAPDLVLPSQGLVILGGAVQIVIGLLLLSQRAFLLAGLLTLMVALPLAALNFSSGRLLDYVFEFVPLALALIFAGLGSGYVDRLICRWLRHNPAHSTHLPVPIIRIGLGVNFVVLALHNKLLSPNLALTFLDRHDLNFISLLGLSEFTNLHFVFATGLMELILGLLLALGIATRFVAAALVTVFLSTLVVLGPIELVGHLPLLGIALLLVYRGSGPYRIAAPVRSSTT